MAQLLENELSIIESTFKMFVRELKQKDPETKLDEGMGFGKFVSELKDEPTILVNFTVFIAEEFLKDSSGNKD